MKYNLNINVTSSIFAVPSIIVDKYISECNEMQLKILLIALRQPDQCISSAKIADILSISEKEVKDCMAFWVQKNIITSRSEPSDEIKPQKPVINTVKPKTSQLTVNDINNIISSNEEVSFLLNESERILAKTLTAADISTIVSLYDWAGIPIDVILMVEEYCKSKGKSNLRYIEKTALAWFEKGINSHEKAEKYISDLMEFSKTEQLVRSAFGIYDRKLITKEREYIHTWFYEYKFDISMVKLAYERTIESIQKLSFPYINSILKSWHDQNVTTPEEVSGLLRPAVSPSASSKINSSSSSYNLSEFEQMMRNSTPKI